MVQQVRPVVFDTLDFIIIEPPSRQVRQVRKEVYISEETLRVRVSPGHKESMSDMV
ncbi:hypothetical protein [Nodularia spumigena]|uniref:hypothetical protein n=1 Tax=Nodularia spumigena TaxID=70799 RepID=UPI00232BDE71|nr:hypothetical protein [Nodularia spumigena]